MPVAEPKGTDELTEFVTFADRVYSNREVRWPVLVPMHLSFVSGESPSCEGRTIRPLVARRGGEIVARVCAIWDERYNAHWDDTLGHVAMFEAMPDSRTEVRELMDEACAWLRERGATAARAGFGREDFPFVIDDDGSLPPTIMRQNPRYYHALLKDAGFETEQGWVDYKMAVTPELSARYERSLDAAHENGFELVPLADLDDPRRTELFTALWGETFRTHWGFVPFTRAEMADLLGAIEPLGAFDTSLVAFREGEPAGFLFVLPSTWMIADGRPAREDEKLNTLGIGVREPFRGRGLNVAMASYAYLKLISDGATWLSYTLVLDHNWPSRRTGERLGGHVCANYVTYRRNFSRRLT